MTLGGKLAKLRKESNLTQEQLAEILGVSRQAVSRWESDVAFPETDKLIRLSELYHCSLDYLLKDAIEEGATESSEPNSVNSSTYGIFGGVIRGIFDAGVEFGRALRRMFLHAKKKSR